MERGVYRVIARPLPSAGARCSFPGGGGGLSFSDSLFLAPQTVGRSVAVGRWRKGRSLGKGNAGCGSVFLSPSYRPQTDGWNAE